MGGWIAVAILVVLLGLLIGAAIAGPRRGYRLDRIHSMSFGSAGSLKSEGTIPKS